MRSSPAPEKYDAPLIAALTPTRADVVDAKRVALETLAARGPLRFSDIVAALRRQHDVPEVSQDAVLDLPRDGDPAVLVRRDVPQLAVQRIESAVRRALAELDAEGAWSCRCRTWTASCTSESIAPARLAASWRPRSSRPSAPRTS